jgi:hypothetical protein
VLVASASWTTAPLLLTSPSHPQPTPQPPPPAPLPPLCAKQVVSLHCNLDDNTRHLINKQRLAAMKPDAVLINAARGPCIDEAALVEHMKAHPDFRCGARLRLCSRLCFSLLSPCFVSCFVCC